MFPTFVIKTCTLAFGYVYPGYQCFKALQKRRPDVKELTFWCRFWVLLAVLTTAEFFLDPLLSWMPMYPELKLALVVFLWHPNTLGADYLYDRFLLPLLARYESVIDHHLKDVQQQVQDVSLHLWRQGCAYAQVQFMELLSYLSSLSTEAARQAYMNRADHGQWSHPEVREVNDLEPPSYTATQRGDSLQDGGEDINMPRSKTQANTETGLSNHGRSGTGDHRDVSEDEDLLVKRLRSRRKAAAS